MENFSDLLTTREVAEALGMRPRAIARLVENGTLKPVLKAPGIRGARFFDWDEIQAYKTALEAKKKEKKEC